MTQQPPQAAPHAAAPPKEQTTKAPQGKSTTSELQVWTVDADDHILLRIDRKDPLRQKIFTVISDLLAAEHRDAEMSRARAMAQVAMPEALPRPNPA